jgi:hypothetical protein
MLEVSDELQREAIPDAIVTEAAVQTEIIKLIKLWSQQPKQRWADLRSRARTQAAHELIAHIRKELEQLEQSANSRRRKRRERTGAKFSGAIERFVGDLLRARRWRAIALDARRIDRAQIEGRLGAGLPEPGVLSGDRRRADAHGRARRADNRRLGPMTTKQPRTQARSISS